MKQTAPALSALVGALLSSAGFVLAAEPTPARPATQTQTQDPIYGNQLMTPQERTEYGTRMRATKTAEEREQIRKTHHEQMQDRARTRGVTLPDEPPARGGGMGQGMGQGGGGMGQGGGAMSPTGGSTGSGVTPGR